MHYLTQYSIYLGLGFLITIAFLMGWASRRYAWAGRIAHHFHNPTLMFGIVLVLAGGAWGWSLAHYRLADDRPADAVEHAVTALAVLVGGSWTLYLFVLRKGFESALALDCAVRTEPCGDEFVVAVEVVLTNTGNRRIAAPADMPSRSKRGWEDCFKYAGDLQIKRVERDLGRGGPRFANWWEHNDLLATVDGVREHISLLEGYRRRVGSAEFIEFLMEPGERYGFTNVFVLPVGHYLAKVVFVGERANEFWSRTVYFGVPSRVSDAGSTAGETPTLRVKVLSLQSGSETSSP